MHFYNPHIHKRRSIRLEGYDYSQEGLYFITLCCQDREHLFGEITGGEMKLNAFGEIAFKEWENTPNIRKNITLHEFIMMPNHIHGIIEIKEKLNREGELQFAQARKFRSPSQTIGSIIRGYKIATIKKIKEKINNSSSTGELQFAPTAPTAPTEEGFAPTEEGNAPIEKKIIQLDYKIWQRNYYEHIIKDEKAYDNISNYIINNPLKWDEDKFCN